MSGGLNIGASSLDHRHNCALFFDWRQRKRNLRKFRPAQTAAAVYRCARADLENVPVKARLQNGVGIIIVDEIRIETEDRVDWADQSDIDKVLKAN